MKPPEPSISVRGGPDVIEASEPSGGSRRAYTVIGSVVLALALGVGLGYQLASRGRTTGDPKPAVTKPPISEAVAGTGRRCSQQLGRQLQLGVEVVNHSTEPVRLQEFAATLPLGGLQVARVAWGTCGQLSPEDGRTPQVVAPGATAWLSAVFDVFGPCPAPDPVGFTVLAVDDADETTAAAIDAGGFADLGDVPYSGCVTPSP